MLSIHNLTATDVENRLNALVALLQNSVDDGASVGFMAPLALPEARAYWQEVVATMHQGHKRLLTAEEDGQLAGAVQLMLEPRANGNHRAEVQKLMVHTDFRRRGIGRMLMEALHHEARRAKRTLLVLDTRSGDAAEQLYQRLGYTQAGVIPHYARNSEGILTGTSFYYIEL